MADQDKAPTPKSPLQAALEKQFGELLTEINERFKQAGDQVLGLSKYIQAQLQIVQNKIRKTEISQQVIDVSNSAVLELMMAKGLVTNEEFSAKVQEIMKRKGLDAPKTEQK